MTLFIRKKILPDSDIQYVFYTGNSMYGTFFPKDSVGYCQVNPDKLKKGDVVLFLQPNNGKLIVHRIARINSQGICTVGDNNNTSDPWLLQPCDITGLAVCRKNADGVFAIKNGKPGWRHFRICQIRRHLFNGLKKMFSPLLSHRLDFIRIQNISVVRYKDQQHYYWHGIRIAREFHGEIQYRKPWFRLFFLIRK